MREILFKAKRISNGEWVEGFYCKRKHYCFDTRTDDLKAVIVTEFSSGGFVSYEVDENTLCQFTGLTDKNGNKIWENDVVHLFGKDTIGNYDWKAVVEFGNPNSLYSWGYQLKPIGNFEYNADILCWVGMEDVNIYCEVNGNIFDNPKLPKEGMLDDKKDT